MKILITLFTMLVMITGCKKEENSTNAEKGEYKMVITQSGDISDFNISATVTGGNTINNGIQDVDGKDLGVSYSLTDAECERPNYTYKTANDAITMNCVISATCEDLTKVFTAQVEVFFNGELIDIQTREFKGKDTSPLTVSHTQIK